MKVTISFLHLEHTEALDERIREKSEKLRKYLDGNINVKWSCYVKDNHHYAEVALSGPHFNYHAKGSTDSLYKSIDDALAKVETQLHKQKDKVKGRRLKHNKSDLVILDPDSAWADYDEDYCKEAI